MTLSELAATILEGVPECEPWAVLSVRPQWASLIMGGAKLYELRRTPCTSGAGHWWLLYASGHVGAIVGAVRVEAVHRLPVGELRALTRGADGLTDYQFCRYFSGRDVGTALGLGRALWLLARPRADLAWMRARLPDWRPPQDKAWVANMPAGAREVLRGLLAACLDRGVGPRE